MAGRPTRRPDVPPSAIFSMYDDAVPGRAQLRNFIGRSARFQGLNSDLDLLCMSPALEARHAGDRH